MRGKGEGTIYKRPNGAYVGQYYALGKRKTVSGKTRKEVQQKLNKALVELQEGLYVDSSKMKLGTFIKDYMENYKKNEVQLSTYTSYEETLETHVYKDVISEIELGKISTDIMQKYYNRKIKDGMSSRGVRNVRTIINGAFKNACSRKLINSNPNDHITMPRKVKHEVVPPTVEDVKKFLEYEKESSIYYGLYRVLIVTGLRRSECLALQKKDINWETGEIMLTHALGYIKNNNIQPELDRKKIYVLKEDMKNKASKSSIFVDEETLIALKKLIRWQESNQKAHKDVYWNKILFMTSDNRFKYVDNDLLFTREDGDFIYGRTLLEWYDKDLDICGIPRCRIHDLRHFFGTNVLQATNDLFITSKMLRHKQISTTANIYLHTDNEKKQLAAEKYKAMLGI
ncbi:MAG: site-specific integrase [Lachnospiraceae bacterium]|nr:site-specific integrase [Lachnospiraceae bacterium]